MDKVEYRPLTIPRVTWEKKALSATHGELVAQPLEPGFGVMLGNALRRVLLAAVEGSAVTSVIIRGVNNEFSVLTGVVEDVMHIVLNVKELVICNKTGQAGTMRLKISKKDVIRASDIKTDKHLEILNKDHVIAHLAPDGELDIEFFVESGRGYQQAQWPLGKPLQDDDRIYLDAMFSPVRKVQYDVEKTRVGKEIDYDKLTLRVDTNGAENPIDIMNYAVSVLRTQLEHFLTTEEIPFNDISRAHQEVQSQQAAVAQHEARTPLAGLPIELLLKPIGELDLPARAHNCLQNEGIKRVIDLANLTEEQGLKIKSFGRKSLDEVKEAMQAVGLTFGMNIKETDVIDALKQKEKSVPEDAD